MTSREKAHVLARLRSQADELDDQVAELALTTWELWARPNQLAPEGDWTYWVVLAGRGFGKTRGGAEWTRESATSGRFQLVNLIGATADDARDIMIEGESGILAVCPRWERPEYRPSKRQLVWPNGCRSLIFTADEPERLRGKQHQRLWADELAAWRYEEAWDQAMLGLRLGPDPRAIVTTTPKPKALLRDLLERPAVTVTKGTTYDNRDNLAPSFFDEIIRKYEGTRLGRQELEAELLLDEGLAYRVEHGVHVIPPFEIPDWWERFEAMDYGRNHPTSWGVFAVDPDENVICFDLYHSPGLASEHAEAIWQRREQGWWARDQRGELISIATYGPPDIRQKRGIVDVMGRELTPETEFTDYGIAFSAAQTDRRAGYLRIDEMLTRRADRVFPNYHPLDGQPASPRFFVFDRESTQPLIQALRDAPLEDPGSPFSRFPGEAVDANWEGNHGDAHAMLRYALMSRTGAPERPKEFDRDPRRQALLDVIERERELEGATDGGGYWG